MIEADGFFTGTAELIFQPGRATSCSVQLPPGSKLRQLVLGDSPARRDAQGPDRWRLPLGPPFMPQRVLVSYQS